MRDLIEKLEGHLQSSKRRLNQLRTGKPGIKSVHISILISILHTEHPHGAFDQSAFLGHHQQDVPKH